MQVGCSRSAVGMFFAELKICREVAWWEVGRERLHLHLSKIGLLSSDFCSVTKLSPHLCPATDCHHISSQALLLDYDPSDHRGVQIARVATSVPSWLIDFAPSASLIRRRCTDCARRYFGSFVAVRLRSFDDFPFLSDRKLRHFDRKQEQELAGCEVNFLPFARF
ncbi:hypothetical protein KFK09_027948 [Dendrobium nobile]|uniref:Uncharacterized protein n=1 Tax=Dendrobium nobile TaxID=94219 RepID=A0A8T3A1X3_DENNO|nr:hypothetical protein KFK09_027948 [Dendrobium nobile]